MDLLGTLDGRVNLLDMKPNEFEHLVRRLFEAMGFEAWTTQASRDDGVDAVARNETTLFGGACAIQAKRYQLVRQGQHRLGEPLRAHRADRRA